MSVNLNAPAGNSDLRIAVPPLKTAPFREVWCVDFEFRGDPGERPSPVCMVAREFHSGREIRLWGRDLLALDRAPFDVGPASVLVAYYASAEVSCFLELGWPPPVNILDLYAEDRVETNIAKTVAGGTGWPLSGQSVPHGNDLLGALALRGAAHIDAGEKESMRRLILERTAWSEVERAAILDYCASDVEGLTALLPIMAPSIDWPRALLRGRYMVAAAQMERAGVPIDGPLYRRLVENWEHLKCDLITEVDADFGVYDGTTFKEARFRDWLSANGIGWPTLKSGRLALDGDTFKERAKYCPDVQPLYELRTTLNGLRLTSLEIGHDDRNRCLLSPFSAVTGRNQPKNSKFIFGPARWMRGLIRPTEGYGLAYIDFTSQEIGIAAALSGDERMAEGYRTGDPYLAFAKDAKLVPLDATKTSHKLIRDRCKSVVLGTNYGMGPESLAAGAGITPCEAKELLRLHRENYRPFWRWSEDTVSAAMLTGEMKTVFGWRQRLQRKPNPRSLMNFPMQANGAEMMRIAAIAATEAGIEVCAPVHDAFLIAAPLDRLDDDVAAMREIMSNAGRTVTGGLEIRTDAEIVRWPDRYMDERGEVMWNKVITVLNRTERAAA
jgi:DNA polymerase I